MKALPIEHNFLGIEEKFSSYENSRIVVLSVPYEHSVSYGKGTGAAPEAIIEASHYVEFWDEQFRRELCFDAGIAAMPALDLAGAVNADAMKAIHDYAQLFVRDNKLVVTLGGEHSITAPLVQAHLERHPGLSVLQFDAHSDLRLSYLDNEYSHASAMARVLDFLPPGRLVQLGIRAQCIEEYELIREHGISTFFAHDMRINFSFEDLVDKVIESLSDEVYITFDVDYLDPSIMPTTGTPEPGGFLWDETIALIRQIGQARRIIGMDVVELSPDSSFPAPTYLCSKLVYKLMNAALAGI
jgi:agmatinase